MTRAVGNESYSKMVALPTGMAYRGDDDSGTGPPGEAGMADIELIGTSGVGRILDISPTAVKLWEDAGRIPPAFARVSPGGRRVWRRADIEAALETAGARRRDRAPRPIAGGGVAA